MKNTIAQNVDPDRVEMASGYRMKTRPAPIRHSKDLVNDGDHWSGLQVLGGHCEAPAAPDQPTALLSHAWTEKTKALKTTGEASVSLRLMCAPRRPPSGSQTGEQAPPGQLWVTRCEPHLLHTMRDPLTLKSLWSSESIRWSPSPGLSFFVATRKWEDKGTQAPELDLSGLERWLGTG